MKKLIQKKEAQLLNDFRKQEGLDFRIHKYYVHGYFCGAKESVYFDYDFAKRVIINLNIFLDDNSNIDISIESLKTADLKSFIEERIYNHVHSIINNQ